MTFCPYRTVISISASRQPSGKRTEIARRSFGILGPNCILHSVTMGLSWLDDLARKNAKT
jgi:hypothetical protein